MAYSPSLKTYAIRLDALAADALLLASLRARMVPLGRDGPDPSPFGHDKPSNSLFVPPEFRSVNCQLCTGAVFDVYLTVNPAPVHCPTTYSASVDGYCTTTVSVPDLPIGFGTPLPWLHSTAFGDGTATLQSNRSGDVGGTHTYHEAGSYTMSHSVLCTCASAFAAGTASRTFAVSPLSACPAPRCSFEFDIEPDAPTISAAPAMPSITAKAKNVDPPGATISWTAEVSYDAGSGCWGGPVYTAEAEGTGKSFNPYLGYAFGGELTITAKCSAPGHASSTVQDTVTVKGTQPTDASIVAEIGSMEDPFEATDLRKIACHESSLTQFQPGTGMPYQGSTDDVGIMQICWDRRIEHLWHWRSNVRRGKDILDEMKDVAENWLDSVLDDHVEATPYTSDMWRREAIHRYNAGNGDEDDAYYDWVVGEGWTVVRSGGTETYDYVERVLDQNASCP